MAEILRFLTIRQALLIKQENHIFRVHLCEIPNWITTVVNPFLGVNKRSSASSDWNPTKTRVQVVFSDLKEDFLAVLFAHVHSSVLGNGGFGIRARVGV